MGDGGVGRAPYRVVRRLFALADQNWPVIDGEAAMHGTNLLGLSIARFCNAVTYWSVQRVEDPKESAHTVGGRLGTGNAAQRVGRRRQGGTGCVRGTDGRYVRAVIWHS